MLKILIWVVSNDGRFFNSALNILGRQHNGIEVVGVTAQTTIQLTQNDKKIPFIPFTELNRVGNYDVLLVVGSKINVKGIGMSRITQAARQLHLPEEKLLGDWIVCIPGFTLEKYRTLQKSRLSIFSPNCFGGLLSHMFGLPFFSPFVNLWLSNPDYLKFLRTPRVYLEEQLVFKETNTENVHWIYPVFTLGNIDVNLNHYAQSNEKNFAERTKRINWYNLFVEMFTEDPKILEQFDELPYGKKVCFVPFKSNLHSAWYVNPEIDKKYQRFADKINLFAEGEPFYYDPFDMLLYGKKTPLIAM